MSNDNYNQDLYELLSAYLDNELSDSQLEKVSQLIQDDAQAQAIIKELKGVSESMSSLPMETVPRSLTDEVLYVLERDTLLDGNDDMSVIAGERHLRFRNFMGAAAIIILIGAVVMVVYSILVPGKIQEGDTYLAKVDTKTSSEPHQLQARKNTNNQIVEFDSIKDAARFISGDGKENTETEGAAEVNAKIAMAKVRPEPVMAAPLPQLPPIKEFEAPKPQWSSLKFNSSIDRDDKITIERLRNLLNSYGEGFLSDNHTDVYTFAFVCRSEKFAELYKSLRENLPGEIDLELENADKYSKVVISSVTGEEVIPLAGLTSSEEQLACAREELSADRFNFTEKVKEPLVPFWQQMATILPEQYQAKLSDSLKEMLEPLELSTPAPEELFASRLEANPKPDTALAEGNTILMRARGVDVEEAVSANSDTVVADNEAKGIAQQSITANVENRLVANSVKRKEAVRSAAAVKPDTKQVEEKAVKAKADFIAIEIVISVEPEEKVEEPVESDNQPTTLINILPLPLESRIDFGAKVQ